MKMLIKPMPGYHSHLHGRAVFLEEGREVVVDEAAKPLHFQEHKDHHAPLRVTPEDYADLKKKFGSQLVCEPIGVPTLDAAVDKIDKLEKENAELKARVVELEQQLVAKSKK